MKQNTIDNLQQKYKRGWYRKGKQYRFLHAINIEGFLLYQPKSKKLKNSREITGVNADFDTWFPNAEYIGVDLQEDEQ